MEFEIAQMAALGALVYIGLAAVLVYLAWSWGVEVERREKGARHEP